MRALLTRLERFRSVDRVGDPARAAVEAVLPSDGVRDALHGRWLGHPLHPAVVQFPLGAWLSATVLDLLPGTRREATTLLIAGTAAALPAAVTGGADFTTLSREQRRVAVLHALANSAALGLMVSSIVARLRGRHTTGRWLSLAGVGVAGGSAMLGGHLSFSQDAGANHSAAALPLVPDGWHDLGATGEYRPGAIEARMLGETPVLVHREDDRFSVLIGRCAHRSGPLVDGTPVEIDGDACLQCPWHGSVFRLRDGRAMRGPASSDQTVLRTRVRNDRLEAARP
ncbi:Rieske (2Fe-2S) protein [Dactylosporangium sp. AC04546]|uniref:Rieske (2Fe-2S) protein n=1 Tax=Dactylosporangium sp. AC04546 TaxID=2862460 RepID=UPI001EDEB68C|nr:Rieske (2Fe-2S) protein [Dactylosporangium sp. AC04546]WVK89213.1 Rieske (2Fe-2S) protein [Dactylosporangium sp. AC04546]